MTNFNYQVGGSLPADAPSYIERQCDREYYDLLKERKYCYVFNCRQMGKSSLRVRVTHKLQAEGIVCATIDPQKIGVEVTCEQWYASAIRSLVGDLDLKSKFDLRSWIRERELLSPVQRFAEFIETVVLQEIDTPIVIFVEEIDRLLSLKFGMDDFFGLVRSFFEDRTKPDYNRITFSFLGVATPTDLIKGRGTSGFNIASAVEMAGFTINEAIPLMDGLANRISNPEVYLEEAINWTGGQPFLMQKLLEMIEKSLNDIHPPNNVVEWVQELVQKCIVSNWESQDAPPHLTTIRDRVITVGDDLRGQMLSYYRQILSDGELESDNNSQEKEKLRLTGLVVKRNGKLRSYNPIYRLVFNNDWIDKQLADLRSPLYAAAFKAWDIADAEQKQDYLLRGQILKEAEEWASEKRTSYEDRSFLRQSREFENAEFQRQAETNQRLYEAERQAGEALKKSIDAESRLRIEEEARQEQEKKVLETKRELEEEKKARLEAEQKLSNINFQYQIGGSLPSDSTNYIERQCDRDYYDLLKEGKYCYVFNCRQTGKSSLRVRVTNRLQGEGIVCATLDPHKIGVEVTCEQWYSSAIRSLVGNLDLKSKFDLRSWIREREFLSPVQRFAEFIETVVLQEIDMPIVIFVEEIDSLLSLKFGMDDFFGLVRSFFEERPTKPDYNRLTFSFLGVATPTDLIQGHHSLFNLGYPVEMAGFTLTEALPLMEGLASKVANPQDYLEAAISWTGGQPFLIQRLLGIIRQELAEITPPENVALWVENLVQERIVTNWESQDTPPHLTTIRDRVVSVWEKFQGRMLGCYQQVLADGELADDRSEERSKLSLTGLVVQRDGRLVSYNPIYAAVFNNSWVEGQLANLRPEFYASAFRAWEDAEEGQNQGFLLRGQALEEAEVWAMGKRLSDVDEHFLRASREFERFETSQQLAATEEANVILVEAERKASNRVKAGSLVLGVMLLLASVSVTWAAKMMSDTMNRVAEIEASKQLRQIELNNLIKRKNEELANREIALTRSQGNFDDYQNEVKSQLKQLNFNDDQIKGFSSQVDTKFQAQKAGELSKNIPKSNRGIKVEYFFKKSEKSDSINIIEIAVKNAGFIFSSDVSSDNLPINGILYGKNVNSDEVKAIAFIMIRAGLRIKAIEPLAQKYDQLPLTIQIGSYSAFVDRELWTEERLQKSEFRPK